MDSKRQPRRSWREIADELWREIDPKKIAELREELDQAVREVLAEKPPTPRYSAEKTCSVCGMVFKPSGEVSISRAFAAHVRKEDRSIQPESSDTKKPVKKAS